MFIAFLVLAFTMPAWGCVLPAIQQPAAPAATVLVIRPDKLTFTVGSGQGSALDQVVSIVNQGGGIMNWSISDNARWIVLQKPSGESGVHASNINVVVDATGMPAGQYTGIVTISAEGAWNSPIYMPVYLDILLGATIPPDTGQAPVPSVTPPANAAVTWKNQAELYRYSDVNAIIVNGSVTNTDKSWYLKDVKIVAAASGASVTIADQIPPGETVMYNRYIPSFQRQEVTLSYKWYRP